MDSLIDLGQQKRDLSLEPEDRFLAYFILSLIGWSLRLTFHEAFYCIIVKRGLYFFQLDLSEILKQGVNFYVFNLNLVETF